MKKLLLLSFVTCFAIACSNQQSQNQNDQTSNLVANIFSDISYNDDEGFYTYLNDELVNGRYTSEFADGSKEADLIFEEGIIRNGQIMREDGTHLSTYSTEAGISIFTSYYDNENPSYRFAFADDMSSPIETRTWFENGNPSVKITRDISKMWHENGQLQSEVELADGKMHGKGLHWHENGELAAETFYKDDEWHGTFKEWDEEGNLVSEKEYDMGRLVSEN